MERPRRFQSEDESQPDIAESPLVIALHSPSTLPETGLRMCPTEKT
jgi:hypothetical protein